MICLLLVQQLYWLQWSFNFFPCFEIAPFVWVTLPQAWAEQLACVVKPLMGTRKDVRMSREPPLLLLSVSFLFIFLFCTSSWSTVAQRWRATGNACCMMSDYSAVIFLPFQKHDVCTRSPLHLVELIHLCCLAFASRACFSSSEFPRVCEKQRFQRSDVGWRHELTVGNICLNTQL